MPKIFQTGERVRIGNYCGIDSNKTGSVITSIQAGRDLPSGSRVRRHERIIRLDDGKICVTSTDNLFHENPLAQAIYRNDWMMTRVKRCKCPDGVRRSVAITGQPDTFFSIPATVRAHGKSVRGYVTGIETDGKPDYEFRPYLYCKNHVVFPQASEAAK